jgi:hypothetical protein
LIVFDDFLNLQKKDMKKISKYLIAGRKFGWSVCLMAQDYVSVPKILVRNINYFVIFKINDNISLNNIIRNHNIADVDSSMHYYSQPLKLTLTTKFGLDVLSM